VAARWNIFKTKIPIGVNFEGLAMDDVGLFYGHLVYFMVIWYIFPHLGILHQGKSGNPGLMPQCRYKRQKTNR
jgi:hypothetical protein